MGDIGIDEWISRMLEHKRKGRHKINYEGFNQEFEWDNRFKHHNN